MTRVAVLVAALLALGARAEAHGLHAEATARDGEVTLELYFSDDSRPEGAEVVVWRVEGQGRTEVGRGATDADGVFRFRAPGPGRYRLEAREPGGHRVSADVAVTAAAPSPVTSAASAPPSSAAHAPTPAPPPARHAGTGTPWLRLGVGLAVIALLAVGLAAWQRRGAA